MMHELLRSDVVAAVTIASRARVIAPQFDVS